MDVSRWLGVRDFTPGTPGDLRWAWLTVALSAVVVVGYAVIAFNRYFQAKLDRRADTRAASLRLINIFACCCVCGVVFYATDMAFGLWRLYDLVLLCVALYAWSFVVRTRALSLVDARLARVDELERTAEQQRALVAQKEEQAKQKAFFLNALSHDLRAPLNIVALNAHLLKTTARDQAEAESAKLIIENAVTAGDLVAKALELAKADAQDRNVVERVAVADVIHQVLRRFAPVAEQKALSLQPAEIDDVELLTDRMKLERIVSNLVDNAIKFTDRGGVVIEAKALEGATVVRVTDTGVGIRPDIAPHLFDEFYQGPAGSGGGREGFGMGLTICRFLARQLGGDVRLARTGTEGSCFDLILPSTLPTKEAARPGFSHIGVVTTRP